MTNRFVFMVIIVCILSELKGLLSLSSITTIQEHSRNRRFILPFPESSTIGMIVAVAVPLDLPNREVFFSYNFEANYVEPDPAFTNYPLVKYGIGRSDQNDEEPIPTNKTAKTHHKKQHKSKQKSSSSKDISKRLKRSLMSRKTAYKIFEEKLQSFGFSPSCLQKVICQASESPLGLYNGVLGDVIHVILTPSTSRDEGISKAYYEAEYNGLLGDCSRYVSRCPKSVFEFISIIK